MHLSRLPRSRFHLHFFTVLAHLASICFTPVPHFLALGAASAAFSWAVAVARVGLGGGVRSVGDDAEGEKIRRRKRWVAGLLLALAALCERSASGRGGLWWCLPLVPPIVLCIAYVFPRNQDGRMTPSLLDLPLIPLAVERRSRREIRLRWLLLATGSAMACLARRGLTPQIAALGLCEASALAGTWCLIEESVGSRVEEFGEVMETVLDEKEAFGGGREICEERRVDACVRDLSLTFAVATGLAAVMFEAGPGETGLRKMLMNWGALSVVVGVGKLWFTVLMISQHGAFGVGILPVYAATIFESSVNSSANGRYLGMVFVLSSIMISSESAPVLSEKTKSRFVAASKTAWFMLLMVATFLGMSFFTVHHFMHATPLPMSILSLAQQYSSSSSLKGSLHPVQALVYKASDEWRTSQSKQSSTLAAATQNYKSRYGIAPPPLFDRWYEFAKSREVQILDDYDTIFNLMLPFWALKPLTIRERVREAIGFEENTLIAVLIRKGEIATIDGGQIWQREALKGMLENFVKWLPDMDLAFNGHDEPRIILANDELSILVDQARRNISKGSLQGQDLLNTFSDPPGDLTYGSTIQEYKFSRFNEYAHQNTYIASRLSCAPGSPARDFSEDREDDVLAFSTGELGFLKNQTAFSDVCLSPSFKGSHAFFDRPNAFNVAHELIPIFSESKISSFQDIVYPSLWHWYGKRPTSTTADMHEKSADMYNRSSDIDWSLKENILYWRGSTTGAYSSHGGWRRQHRQQIVQKINALDNAKVLGHHGVNESQSWHVYDVPRRAYKDLIDVKFSGIGQCDPGDCDAQKEFFDVEPFTDMQDNWKSKHLLDMDGNAFSARFYALLRSKSLVYKMAIFREWHEEWLKPWLHYIPLSLKGKEHLETVRWFAQDEEGKELAKTLAASKREWAQRALRREDMETWFFRLLLEYARVQDDARDRIGFVG